jgi:4-hydroxy-2-oxoheptanedioate aldolase
MGTLLKEESRVRINHVKRHLKAGKPSIGAWLLVPEPLIAEHVARLGFDWIAVDMEHSPVCIESLAHVFMAMVPAPVAPMVRLPWNTGENIKRVLDAGAWGIIVPMVNNRAQAEAVVEAAKYPTTGARSLGSGRYLISFDADQETYIERANEEILVVVQAEHIDAVENAEEILSVPGIDACFIGPWDLMASMGINPARAKDEPRVDEAIEHVRQTAVKYGVAPGIHVPNAQAANRRIEEGFQFIALGTELAMMLAGLKGQLSQVNW